MISTGGSLLGMGLGQSQQQQQYQQQQNLMNLQMQNQMTLNSQGHDLQKKMWDYTNYENQRKHMEKAGLNVGLMYGQGGGGGTTAGGQSGGGASGGNAPGFNNELIGMGLQLGMQKAQIDLMKAQTEKTKAEAEKTSGVDTTLAQTQIDGNKIQNLFNTENLQTALEKSKAELDNTIANTNKQVAEGELSKIDGLTRNWKNTTEILNKAMNTKQMDNKIQQEWKSLEIDYMNALTNVRNATTNEQNADSNEMNARTNKARLKIEELKAKVGKFQAETERNYPGVWNVAGKTFNDGFKAMAELLGGNLDDTSTTTKVK